MVAKIKENDKIKEKLTARRLNQTTQAQVLLDNDICSMVSIRGSSGRYSGGAYH